MEVISINQLRVMLGDLAMNHKFVNDFFWGDIDSMRAWKGRIAQYPLVTAYSTAVQVNKTTKLITFNLEVSDKLYSDYDRNINEIESDTEQTIQDLFDGMRNFAQWKKIGVVQNDSFNATKFINQTGDTVAGWRASITLKLIKNQGLCLAPFEGFTPTPAPPIVCEPATVTNSNDTFFQSILSGASYILPDNMVTDSDGTVMLIPAQTPFVCTPQLPVNEIDLTVNSTPFLNGLTTDQNILLKDQNGNDITPVINGNELEVYIAPPCPDATLTLNGSSFITVPSGATEDIELINEGGSDVVPLSVVGSVITLEDKLYMIFNYEDLEDLFVVNITPLNVGTFTSQVATNIGVFTYSSDGITFATVTYPFTPLIGTGWFKRSNYAGTGTLQMIGI